MQAASSAHAVDNQDVEMLITVFTSLTLLSGVCKDMRVSSDTEALQNVKCVHVSSTIARFETIDNLCVIRMIFLLTQLSTEMS